MAPKSAYMGPISEKGAKYHQNLTQWACLFVVCLFEKEPLFRRGYGRGPLYEVPVSHSSSKVGIHPPL